MTSRRAVGLVALAFGVPFLLGLTCPRSPGGDPASERVVVSDGWLAMGTFFEVDLRVQAGEEAAAREWLDWARSEVSRLEEIYSRWQPQSELSRLNRALARASAGEPIALGPELTAILAEAIDVSARSQGAFDVTIGKSVALWREAARSGEPPSEEALGETRRAARTRSLSVDERAGAIAARPGVEIDLDGLSKGAVLDRLATRLATALPGTPALLSFGQSSLLAIGDPDGRGWRLAVRSRKEGEPILARLALRDRALSVSSSRGASIEIGGHRFSHVIDPRDGRPVAGLVEAVVVGRRAARVDAWSTALLVLGGATADLREGLAALEREGLDAWVGGASTSAETKRWFALEVVEE